MELPKVTVDKDYNINKPDKSCQKNTGADSRKAADQNQVRDDKVAYKDCARQRGRVHALCLFRLWSTCGGRRQMHGVFQV